MSPLQEESLCLNGERISAATLPAWRRGKEGILSDVADFLAAWWGAGETVPLHSSGSTGAPKTFDARKAYLRASARASLAAFGLPADGSALLCLPLRYIAGKMMVVRALVGGWQLTAAEPSSTPLSEDAAFDFAAMVPMQAARTLELPDGAARLSRIGTLLLGGGFIDPALEQALAQLPTRVYVSYGMTETYSHIALRRLNGAEQSPYYTPLSGVQVSLSAGGTLCITAPHIGVQGMETNDIADITPDGRFRILGRRDAVINSGGVKIQAESIETALAARGITALALPQPDPLLGQTVALLHEPCDPAALQAALDTLPRYHRPKALYPVDTLPRTATGKPARAAAAAWLKAQNL